MRCCWGLWMYIVCNVTGCGISQQNGRTLLPESGLWPVVFLRLFDMGWTGRSDVLIKWLQWCTPCRSIFCCISSFLALDDFSTSTWHRPNAFAQQDSLGIRFSQPAGVMGPGGLWISRIQSTWGHWKIETFQQIAEGPQDSGQNESFFLLHWLWKLACASWSCLL